MYVLYMDAVSRSTTLHPGHSVSLSFDGRVLAVGGPSDNASEGAAWIFKFDGSTYQQIGSKLVGVGSSGISRKGKAGAPCTFYIIGRGIHNDI